MKPIRRSLHRSRRLRIAHIVETSNSNFTPIWIYTYIYLIPLVQIHHWLTSITRAVHKHTQRASSLLCSWQVRNFLRTSESSKPKRMNTPLSICPSPPPATSGRSFGVKTEQMYGVFVRKAKNWRKNRCYLGVIKTPPTTSVLSWWPGAYYAGDQERPFLLGGKYYLGWRILLCRSEDINTLVGAFKRNSKRLIISRM